MSLPELVHLSAVLVLLGVIVADVEQLAEPEQLRPSGLYSWAVLRTARPWTVAGPLARPLESILEVPGVLVLLGLRVGLAVLTLATWGTPVGEAALAGVLAAGLLVHVRNLYGMDGSDQMQSIVLTALVVYGLAPTATGRALAFGFIAAQSILSYLASGYAKLISPTWRSGAAVLGVMNTRSYGGPILARAVGRRRGVSRAICWATIVFECFMPFLVFLGHGPCLAFIAAGIAFHAGIALTMGLNIFFWSFVATYPALYWLSGLT